MFNAVVEVRLWSGSCAARAMPATRGRFFGESSQWTCYSRRSVPRSRLALPEGLLQLYPSIFAAFTTVGSRKKLWARKQHGAPHLTHSASSPLFKPRGPGDGSATNFFTSAHPINHVIKKVESHKSNASTKTVGMAMPMDHHDAKSS